MVPASHILRHGICPTRKQHPTWSSIQRLPSPAWHLAVSIDCVRYQHSVNQSQFSGSKGVSQGSACSHGKMGAQRERFWGLPLWLAGSGIVVRGLERFNHGEQQAVISLLLCNLSLSTECCCWQQRPERDGWERIIRGRRESTLNNFLG